MVYSKIHIRPLLKHEQHVKIYDMIPLLYRGELNKNMYCRHKATVSPGLSSYLIYFESYTQLDMHFIFDT